MPKLFIDLEETVIQEFGVGANITFIPENCAAIANFITNVKKEDFGILEIFIFSFAIHTDEELDWFDAVIYSELENKIGHSINGVVTVPQMFVASQQIHHTRFEDVTDFLLTRGKEGAFQDWCDFNFKEKHCLLIDDVVRNMSIINHDTLVTISTFNISDVRKEYESKRF